MSQSKRIRDPVHGFIVLDGREIDILNTPLLQRLRNIKQLALASLVYPGATHTRFDHTLGVLHVADRMCRVLKVNDTHRSIIRRAALLHDVGHGPFSHVSESVLDILAPASLAVQAGGKKDKIHEVITQRIVRERQELDESMARRDREDIVALLTEGLDDPLHRSIISGPLDADKQDYLPRDTMYCGVRYGIFDLDQLHNSLMSISHGSLDALMVARSGLHTLEQFVLAKYYLTTQVYRHKVRLISDSMIIRALTLGVQQDEIEDPHSLYVYDGSEDFIANYLKWDDARLTVELLQDKYRDKIAGQLFRRIADRQLFKRIYSRQLSHLQGQQLAQVLPPQKTSMECKIAEYLSRLQPEPVRSEFVILHTYLIDSVRKQSRNAEGSILIHVPEKPDKPEKLEDGSVLFRSINEKLNENFIECYAAVNFKDERDKKNQLDQIREFIDRGVFTQAIGESKS